MATGGERNFANMAMKEECVGQDRMQFIDWISHQHNRTTICDDLKEKVHHGLCIIHKNYVEFLTSFRLSKKSTFLASKTLYQL
jgi:hypothetical protein